MEKGEKILLRIPATTSFYRRMVQVAFACTCLIFYAFTQSTAEGAPMQTLTIMADPSLRVPITLIARRYALDHHLSVSTSFNSTKEQIAQIEKGAEAGILLAARPEWVDDLQQKGLIDIYSRKNIARNRLVLAGSEFELQSVDIQAAHAIGAFTDHPDGFTFIIGDAGDTAEGNYAEAALHTHHLSDILAPYVLRLHTSYQITDTISRYHSMGITFRSDALLFPDIKEMSVFKPKDHPPILYQGVVIVGDEMDSSRRFLTYLASEEAWHILKTFGFDPA